MITFSKFKSAVIEGGKRILKVSQYGAKTAKESYPFGFDSCPLENYTAVYSETSNSGEAVIIGYINTNQICEPGESRIFSENSVGDLVGSIWLRKNGDLQLNGDQFTSVRFGPLLNAVDLQNVAINAELVKIQSAISLLGGSYIPGQINFDPANVESSTVKLK